MLPVWKKQFSLHAGRPVRVILLDKGSVKDKMILARGAFSLQKADRFPLVLVINYESVWREPFGAWALAQEWDCVILDEATRSKEPGGKLSTYVAALGKRAAHRLCLSGTPMSHGPLDLYGQFRFLEPDIFGTNFARFRARYAEMGGFHNYQVKKYVNQDELNEKFYSVAFRVTDEVLDLPEQISLERICTLGPKAQKTYRELEHGFYAEVTAGQITLANALTRLLRLQQITSGYLALDDGTQEEIDDAKQRLLADILDELDRAEPLVVFVRFRHDIAAVRAVAQRADTGGPGKSDPRSDQRGRRVGELSGTRNDLARWQHADCEVLIVQIASGSAGIDLTRARYSIYYSVGFSLEQYDQSRKRTHRPGQSRTSFAIHLIAEGTVDRKVYQALADKRDVIEYVLGHPGRESDE